MDIGVEIEKEVIEVNGLEKEKRAEIIEFK